MQRGDRTVFQRPTRQQTKPLVICALFSLTPDRTHPANFIAARIATSGFKSHFRGIIFQLPILRTAEQKNRAEKVDCCSRSECTVAQRIFVIVGRRNFSSLPPIITVDSHFLCTVLFIIVITFVKSSYLFNIDLTKPSSLAEFVHWNGRFFRHNRVLEMVCINAKS